MDLAPIVNWFTSTPTDIIILGALAILIALDSISSGARRISTLALALPPAALLLGFFGEAAFLEGVARQISSPLFSALLFLLLTALFYALIGRIGLSWDAGSGGPALGAIAGVAGTAIIVVFWLETPGLESLWSFSKQISAVFAHEYRFWWLAGSYAALAFVRG